MKAKRITGALVLATILAWAGQSWALDQGAKAPGFQLKDLSGKTVSLADYKGKVVVVDFWASWCAPCREELPVLERLSKTYADQGLVVLGVNIDNQAKAASEFLQKLPVTFTVLHDADKQVAKAYAPPTMPSSYIIDREGNVRLVQKGFKAADAAKLEAEIKKLLN